MRAGGDLFRCRAAAGETGALQSICPQWIINNSAAQCSSLRPEQHFVSDHVRLNSVGFVICSVAVGFGALWIIECDGFYGSDCEYCGRFINVSRCEAG